MDCSGASFPNSGPLKFGDTDSCMGNSTVEPEPKSSNDDGSNKEKKVRKRTAFSQKQLQELHTYFYQNAYLDSEQMRHLSRRLGLTHTQVRKWFQNMRMKRRKQMNVLAQEFQLSTICDPSVMNSSGIQGVGQPPVGQPPVGQPPVGQPPVGQPPVGQPPVGQQGSWTNNITQAIKMDDQSWDDFFHLQTQQKTLEFPNDYDHQAIAVPTYSNPYLEPHTVQPNYGMDQSWNMPLGTNLQGQQNRENYQTDLVYDYSEANSMAR